MNKIQIVLDFFFGLSRAIQPAWLPTLVAVLNTPSLFLKPREVSRIFMGHVWAVYGDGVDQRTQKPKEELVTPRAYGIVLDIGAGHGHLVKYLDRSRVTAYFALEPNLMMHEHIIKTAHEAGFREEDGTFLIIPFPLESTNDICAMLTLWSQKFASSPILIDRENNGSDQASQAQVIDTIVCILTLCSVPSPTVALKNIIQHVLRPCGQFLFYEHVRSPSRSIAYIQDIVAPIWRVFFDGCIIGQDSIKVIQDAGMVTNGNTKSEESLWADIKIWEKEDEDPNSLFYHQLGQCLRK